MKRYYCHASTRFYDQIIMQQWEDITGFGREGRRLLRRNKGDNRQLSAIKFYNRELKLQLQGNEAKYIRHSEDNCIM